MEEDRLGLRLKSEVVEIQKDAKGLVGVSIGGGFPYCPCVYVVQIFEGGPVDVDGRVKCGDEVVAVNGQSVKGEKKSAVAQLIQKAPNPVKMTINHLEIEPERGKTMDIALKKIKHKMVEFMEADVADALGLSRAILCNDPLLQKMRVLENNATLYRTLVDELTFMLKSLDDIAKMQKEFGDLFCDVGAHESHVAACEAFVEFGNSHRLLEKRQSEAIVKMRPLVSDLATYVDKAVPDTQLTVKKYLDVKYEYLSFCLKLKEMDDEEMEILSLGEPLYRVETGNYEYRVMLRSRQDSRGKFSRMRRDVMVKIELLDQKHVRDLAMQLGRFAGAMKECQSDCAKILETTNVAPVEIDMAQKIATTAEEGGPSTAAVEEAEEAREIEPEINLLDMEDSPRVNGGDLISVDLFAPSSSHNESPDRPPPLGDLLIDHDSAKERKEQELLDILMAPGEPERQDLLDFS